MLLSSCSTNTGADPTHSVARRLDCAPTMGSSNQILQPADAGVIAFTRPSSTQAQVKHFEGFILGYRFGACYAYSTESKSGHSIEVKIFFTRSMTIQEELKIYNFVKKQKMFEKVAKERIELTS